MRSGIHTTAGFVLAVAAGGLLLGSTGSAAAGARGAALDSAGDARHDARRRDRPGREGHRDAGVQRAGRARTAIPAGVRDRPGNPAVAHLDDDRPLSGRPRRARERAVPRRRTRRCSPSARARRLSDRRVRLVVRAVAPVRPRARLRALRRRAAGRAPTSATRRRRHGRALAYLAQQDSSTAAVPLGPLLRSPRALRTAGAVPGRLRHALPGRGGRRGRAARAPGRRRSKRGGRAGGDRSLPAITARGSATTARSQHGNLLYQSTMHVPLVIVGTGGRRGDGGRSGQHAADLSHGARLGRRQGSPMSLRGAESEVVLGEAMKPFLEYGWRPQTMAVSGGDESDSGGHDRGLRPRQPIPAETQEPRRGRQPAGGMSARRSTTTRFRP